MLLRGGNPLIDRSLVKRRRKLGARPAAFPEEDIRLLSQARPLGGSDLDISQHSVGHEREKHPLDPRSAPRNMISTRVAPRWNPGLSLPGKQSFNRSSLGP